MDALDGGACFSVGGGLITSMESKPITLRPHARFLGRVLGGLLPTT